MLSADSIWLYFATAPRDAARIRADYYPSGPFRFYAQVVADFYNTRSNPDLVIADHYGTRRALAVLLGGSAGTIVPPGHRCAAAPIHLKAGYGGRQVWVDVNLGWAPENGLVQSRWPDRASPTSRTP